MIKIKEEMLLAIKSAKFSFTHFLFFINEKKKTFMENFKFDDVS